jgi:hypothetical protein
MITAWPGQPRLFNIPIDRSSTGSLTELAPRQAPTSACCTRRAAPLPPHRCTRTMLPPRRSRRLILAAALAMFALSTVVATSRATFEHAPLDDDPHGPCVVTAPHSSACDREQAARQAATARGAVSGDGKATGRLARRSDAGAPRWLRVVGLGVGSSERGRLDDTESFGSPLSLGSPTPLFAWAAAAALVLLVWGATRGRARARHRRRNLTAQGSHAAAHSLVPPSAWEALPTALQRLCAISGTVGTPRTPDAPGSSRSPFASSR